MYYVTDRKNSSSRPVIAVQPQQTVLELEPTVIPKGSSNYYTTRNNNLIDFCGLSKKVKNALFLES